MRQQLHTPLHVSISASILLGLHHISEMETSLSFAGREMLSLPAAIHGRDWPTLTNAPTQGVAASTDETQSTRSLTSDKLVASL